MKTTQRPKIPEAITRAILIEAGHRCAVCGTSCPLERAHIIPWSKVKEHTLENLILLCANCHERADKEVWGEEILKAYKAKPWVLRNPETPSTATVRKKLQLHIILDWESFDENHEKLIIAGLSSFLKLPPDAIKVRARKKGSVKLDVSIPELQANLLLAAFEKRDEELFLYLNQYKILEIEDLGSECAISDHSQSTSDGCGKAREKNVDQSDADSSGRARKLYVGNLPFSAKEEEIRALFQRFGSVADIHLPMDRISGRPRGFAFVTMGSADEADAACEKLNEMEFGGRNLTVNHARPKDGERPAGGGSGPGGGRSGGDEHSAGSY
jgi:hypothetical protein